jgi:hypothetical protein
LYHIYNDNINEAYFLLWKKFQYDNIHKYRLFKMIYVIIQQIKFYALCFYPSHTHILFYITILFRKRSF